jgi:hypothetical protein
MKKINIYYWLRSIGFSVESADLMEPILESLSDKKREIFILWAMDYTYREIAKVAKIPRTTCHKVIMEIKSMANYQNAGDKVPEKCPLDSERIK